MNRTLRQEIAGHPGIVAAHRATSGGGDMTDPNFVTVLPRVTLPDRGRALIDKLNGFKNLSRWRSTGLAGGLKRQN